MELKKDIRKRVLAKRENISEEEWDKNSRIIYEKRLMGQLIIHDVVKIAGIPQEIGRDEMFGLISDYFECYTAHHNTIFLKNNPHSEAYEARVVFDRCEIYEK